MQAAPVAVIVLCIVDPVQTVAGADVGWSCSRLRQHHDWILLLGLRCGSEVGRFCWRQLRRTLSDWQRGQIVNQAIQRLRVRHRRDVMPTVLKSVGNSSAHGLNGLFPQ